MQIKKVNLSDLQANPNARGSQQARISSWPEWSAIGLFAAVVAYAIPYHEPWADEAQAWQLARTLSLRALFETYIRYEGSPGLWHLLLWILIRLHLSYAGLHWLCGAIAIASTSLLVLKSPFPRYLKLTLPFTYFFLFQYAVVARSYVLVPPLLFLIAAWWKRRPVLVAIALGLLANVSLHAAVISGGLAIVNLLELIREGGVKDSAPRRRILLCVLMVLSFYAFALWTAWPPADLTHHLSDFRQKPRPIPVLVFVALAKPICQPMFLALPFWIAIVMMFRARRSLFYLLPVLLFALFSGIVTGRFWHLGLLVSLLICLLWIQWPATTRSVTPFESIGRAAIVYMVAVQILWSGYALKFDHYNAYSPDLAATQFLNSRIHQGTMVAVTYLGDDPSVVAIDAGILPYFNGNIYLNQRDSFYWWGDDNPTEDTFLKLLPSHPGIVLVETQQFGPGPLIQQGNPKVELLTSAGYQFTQSFCGTIPERMQSLVTNCHLIFQYSGKAK